MSEKGKEWASFLEKQQQVEEARRSSVVTRGGAAVASAAGLVTLVLALFAVFLGKDFQTSGPVAYALGTAVLALLVSAVCGVVVVSPWRYGRATISGLRALLNDDLWNKSDEAARKSTMDINIDNLEELQGGTNTQVKWLSAAGYAQVAAVVALAAATLIVVICPKSEVQQARDAMKNQPGMSKFLDAVDAVGLLNSREDVVKIASFYRLSCEAIDASITQSPDNFRDHLKSDLGVTASVDQVKTLEPARAELCAAR